MLTERSGFAGIGGIWIAAQDRDASRRALADCASQHGLNSELKWQKVSAKSLGGYVAFVDTFFTLPINFRVLLVEKATVDLDSYHRGDPELGFYKFYFRLLAKWIDRRSEYVVLLDHKCGSRPSRHTELRRVLGNAVGSDACIRQLTFVDSRESKLSQLVDVLTGAVTAAWSGTRVGTAKHALQQHIAHRLSEPSLLISSSNPEHSKFNVFKMDLSRSRSVPERAAGQPPFGSVE